MDLQIVSRKDLDGVSVLRGNTKPRPLWCGFGFVTNILQGLKTAFDDRPNFPFLSLIPVFLTALLCPTLKWMFPFLSAYTFQIFALGFLSCPFCQLREKAYTFKAISSKFYNPFSHFCFSFLIFFLYDNTLQSSSGFPSFTAVLQEAAIPFQPCYEMPWYLCLYQILCFSKVLDHSQVWSGIASFSVIFPLCISLLNTSISPSHKPVISTSAFIL